MFGQTLLSHMSCRHETCAVNVVLASVFKNWDYDLDIGLDHYLFVYKPDQKW